MQELIYYIRKPGSRVVIQEEVIEDTVSPLEDKGKGWYRDTCIKDIKLSRGKPIGVVVSNSYGKVGYSLCSHGDSFDKKKGLMIAREREKNGFNLENVPEFMKEHLNIMLEKSRRAFKS